MAGITTSSRELKNLELGSGFFETIAVRVDSDVKTEADNLTMATGSARSKSADSTGARHATALTGNKTHSELIRLSRTHSHCARDLAEQLIQACETDEFMDQFRIGNELDEQLKMMWKYGKGRDEMWGKLLKFFPISLKDCRL